MKIGIVCYPTYGGSGVVATELGMALAKRGHSIHFVTYSLPTRLDYFNENIFYHEVIINTYPLFQYPPYELALASKLVDVVSHEKLDLVHVHYAIPHASAAWLAKQILAQRGIHVPIVTTLHGTDITLVGQDPSYEPVVTYSINMSDAVTAVSESLRQDTYNLFPITREIEVIHNFIDLERFQKRPVEHFKRAICPDGESLIVHTSNFRAVKRVDDVIKVFCGIQKAIPAKLLLVGDGPERQKMEQLCREYGINDDVRFLGKLDAVEDILSVADLFIMPSEKESFGLAALEAMACEVPVISTNSGGLPELNIDGVTGYMAEIGDVRTMIEKSLYILLPENLPRFKKAARKRAQDFDISRILPKYEACYERLLVEEQ